MLLVILLVLVICMGLVIALIQLTTRWALFRATRQIEHRFRAAEAIVNEGQVPEMWVRSFRQRIDKIRQSGGTDDDIERVGRQAHQHCLRQLDSLIRFLQDKDFFDSPETRSIVLKSLHQQRDKWATEGWQALIESVKMSSQ